MNKLIQVCCFMLVVALFGCKDPAAEKASTDPATEEKTEVAPDSKPAAEDTPKADPDAKPVKVTVEKAGTKFDPAITPEQVPVGAWFCPMEAVHWAASEKPADGKCPTCGMKVTRAGEKKADDGHGHDHEHGHEH